MFQLYWNFKNYKTTTTKRVSLFFPLKFHYNMTRDYFILYVMLRIHCLSEFKDSQFLWILENSQFDHLASPPACLLSSFETPIKCTYMPDPHIFFVYVSTLLSYLYLFISPWWILCSCLKSIFHFMNSSLCCI